MKKLMGRVLSVILLTMMTPLSAQTDGPRDRVNFDAGWLFQRGDPADLPPNQIDYAQLKDYLLAASNGMSKSAGMPRPLGNPGANISYVKPDFPDQSWRQLDLPHDWAIEGPFDINLPGATGKLPWVGAGWYRKHFTLPAADAGRRIFLDIDGAMSYSAVWVNGQLAGGWPYGYTSFEVDITSQVKPGEENVIAIRLNNPPESSRWYPGAGIYRNVWLVKTAPVHIAQSGTSMATLDATGEVAHLEFKAALINQGERDADTQTTTSIYQMGAGGRPGGAAVATIPMTAANVPAGQVAHLEMKLEIPHPALWSLERPSRYLAVTDVRHEGQVIDRYETPFGIRTIRFDPDHGFFLNGTRVQLQGVCDHHDLGALGTAFNTRAAERQLEILKGMGCNALRTSHNPPAPELLDLCDRMGMLVMDESFDCWRGGKTTNDYHLLFDDWLERDLRSQFRRDRNHPSVIIWSLGNEMPDLWAHDRAQEAALLTAIAHDEDPTRPTTVASNNQDTWIDGPNGVAIQHGLDMYGQNYPTANQNPLWSLFDRYHAAFPGIPIFGSETSSATSSRGIYFFPVTTDPNGGCEDFQVSSYDLYSPGWGCTPDADFAALDHSPFVPGDFVWTGFDYLGEPTPYNSDPTNLLNFHDPAKLAALKEQLDKLGKIPDPARSSYFGIVDLCGFKKDRYYLYQAQWRPNLPMAHILPHWNWPDRVGKVTPVFVYTSGDEAELFLNGKSQGRRTTRVQALPTNLALNQVATASSDEVATGSQASHAVDGSENTRWCAADGSKNQWWQVDLGKIQPVRSILIDFESSANNYQYTISASLDGANWKQVVTKNDWSGDSTTVHPVDFSARYLKIQFTDLVYRMYASIREVGIYSTAVSVDSFYQDHYRMRWSDVVYEPGELNVVTYKEGRPWANARVKTTGPADGLKLEADRALIHGDGKDLSYITTRVIDAQELTVPTAQQRIRYEIVSGPGKIVATDNGDPTDLETFSNPERRAFNGLALLILRGTAGQTGDVTIRATADGLNPAETVVHMIP